MIDKEGNLISLTSLLSLAIGYQHKICRPLTGDYFTLVNPDPEVIRYVVPLVTIGSLWVLVPVTLNNTGLQ